MQLISTMKDMKSMKEWECGCALKRNSPHLLFCGQKHLSPLHVLHALHGFIRIVPAKETLNKETGQRKLRKGAKKFLLKKMCPDLRFIFAPFRVFS
jgi:hypothetical protein